MVRRGLERDGHHVIDSLPAGFTRDLSGLVTLVEVVDEGDDDLEDDRVLGAEVVVEAAREDADLVGDVPHGGAGDAALTEQLGRMK